MHLHSFTCTDVCIPFVTRLTASIAERKQRSRGASTSTKGPPTPPPAMPAGFRPPARGLVFQHAVMNLPASAVLFLDAFNGAFDTEQWRGRQLPMVHCYTFMKNETEAGGCSTASVSCNACSVLQCFALRPYPTWYEQHTCCMVDLSACLRLLSIDCAMFLCHNFMLPFQT